MIPSAGANKRSSEHTRGTNCTILAVAESPESALASGGDFVGAAGDLPPRTCRFPANARGNPRTGQVHAHRNPNCNAQLATTSALRDQLVLKHLPLVKVIAVHLYQGLPGHVDLEEMVQAGILGLFDAASKYDYEQQVVFPTYAKHRIKGAILDSLRQLDWASRDMRRLHKQVEAATSELTAKLKRDPIETEVAEKLGVDLKYLRTRMLALRNGGPVSALARREPPVDFPDTPEGQPDWICARAEVRRALSKAVQSLPERYQKVVLLYYNHEMTMKEIGSALAIQESRVSQIHKSALAKMATVLETLGITSASQCVFSTNAHASTH
jgi:RNA polymerase sigma factor FliA